jgi:hypothetical protein
MAFGVSQIAIGAVVLGNRSSVGFGLGSEKEVRGQAMTGLVVHPTAVLRSVRNSGLN